MLCEAAEVVRGAYRRMHTGGGRLTEAQDLSLCETKKDSQRRTGTDRDT